MRRLATAISLAMLAAMPASVASAWSFKTGTDPRSGTKFAVASQTTKHSPEILAIECQHGKDLMVGVATDIKAGPNTIFLNSDFVEFRVGTSPAIRVPADLEAIPSGEIVYTTRRSSRPDELKKLILYLYDNPGDVQIRVGSSRTQQTSPLSFREDDRRKIIETLLSFCDDIKAISPETASSDPYLDANFRIESLPAISKTYSDNQARFVRDYRGKTFSANLLITGIRESLLERNQFSISFGSKSSSDVMCNSLSPEAMSKIFSLNKGDSIYFKGRIEDHSFGMLILKNCLLSVP